MKQSASGDLLLWDVTLNFVIYFILGVTTNEILERDKAATNKILPQKSGRSYRGNQFYTSESY
ncbi:hypothetical protein T03_10706 [Trichinella britovi]|uniref:Uncharacterized protein n=1 Tax=Trichinella britovi TaxID=45882 RepID=A0A0V1CA81_TRIBR|nr:hypothetical protein T03_10706 [Trichinella britovi]